MLLKSFSHLEKNAFRQILTAAWIAARDDQGVKASHAARMNALNAAESFVRSKLSHGQSIEAAMPYYAASAGFNQLQGVNSRLLNDFAAESFCGPGHLATDLDRLLNRFEIEQITISKDSMVPSSEAPSFFAPRIARVIHGLGELGIFIDHMKIRVADERFRRQGSYAVIEAATSDQHHNIKFVRIAVSDDINCATYISAENIFLSKDLSSGLLRRDENLITIKSESPEDWLDQVLGATEDVMTRQGVSPVSSYSPVQEMSRHTIELDIAEHIKESSRFPTRNGSSYWDKRHLWLQRNEHISLHQAGLAWVHKVVDQYKSQTGFLPVLPEHANAEIPGHPGLKFSMLDAALQHKKKGLAQSLNDFQGYFDPQQPRIKGSAVPTKNAALEMILNFLIEKREFPTRTTSDAWNSIDSGLRKKRETTLSQVIRSWVIEQAARYQAETGQKPGPGSGFVDKREDIDWAMVIEAIQSRPYRHKKETLKHFNLDEPAPLAARPQAVSLSRGSCNNLTQPFPSRF